MAAGRFSQHPDRHRRSRNVPLQAGHRNDRAMSGSSQPMLLLRSPLGDDTLPVQQGTLHAIALDGTEQLSQPYEFRLTVVSTQRSIDPDELLYQPVCLTIRRKPLGDRYLHGIVRRVEAVGLPRRDRWTYHLDVVPQLWFLGQT